jgi:hypothetical protein
MDKFNFPLTIICQSRSPLMYITILTSSLRCEAAPVYAHIHPSITILHPTSACLFSVLSPHKFLLESQPQAQISPFRPWQARAHIHTHDRNHSCRSESLHVFFSRLTPAPFLFAADFHIPSRSVHDTTWLPPHKPLRPTATSPSRFATSARS